MNIKTRHAIRHHVSHNWRHKRHHCCFKLGTLVVVSYVLFLWVATTRISSSSHFVDKNRDLMNDTDELMKEVTGDGEDGNEEGELEANNSDNSGNDLNNGINTNDNHPNVNNNDVNNNQKPVEEELHIPGDTIEVETTPSCAICFFGLPRSFASMVLPSMIRNVFLRNARHGCDYFVHYYHREEEPGGRAGEGGKLNPDEVLLMKSKIKLAAQKIKETTNRDPSVVFVKDTEEEFWQKRGDLVEKYRTAKDPRNGKYLYYPWKAVTYHYPESIDNIAKQWHSIQSVWEAMEEYTKLTGEKYERVAMLRLDVMYAFPVDIFKTSKHTTDKQNQYAVSPAFAKYPVNDRMFYGPYEAVRIWATERFTRIDEHVKTYEPGWGMHSERFLDKAIFSAIKAKGIPMVENPDLCVMRVRADMSVWMNDCLTMGGSTRGIKRIAKQRLVEKILGRKCIKSKLRVFFQLHCPYELQGEEDGRDAVAIQQR